MRPIIDRVRILRVIILGLTCSVVGCSNSPENVHAQIDANTDTDAGSDSDASDSDGGGGEPKENPDGGEMDSGGPQEPVALSGMTAEHNKVRDLVGVGPLIWDSALAAIARDWAETCTDNQSPTGLLDHNPGRSDGYPGYVGENIYASTGTATAIGAVMSWASEKNYYDYESNTCAVGKVCGHYTQMVWSDTLRVGCGIALCPKLKYASTIVCNYSPGGNYPNQQPY